MGAGVLNCEADRSTASNGEDKMCGVLPPHVLASSGLRALTKGTDVSLFVAGNRIEKLRTGEV
jgi:hypothetical protein